MCRPAVRALSTGCHMLRALPSVAHTGILVCRPRTTSSPCVTLPFHFPSSPDDWTFFFCSFSYCLILVPPFSVHLPCRFTHFHLLTRFTLMCSSTHRPLLSPSPSPHCFLHWYPCSFSAYFLCSCLSQAFPHYGFLYI